MTEKIDLYSMTLPELESFLSEKYDEAASIVIDCEKLSYISSAGLRVLLTAHKKNPPMIPKRDIAVMMAAIM